MTKIRISISEIQLQYYSIGSGKDEYVLYTGLAHIKYT
jgi:hypothetical protein